MARTAVTRDRMARLSLLFVLAIGANAAQLLRTHGEFTALLEKAGGRPVIVDYFAVTCAPCQKIMPVFDQLSAKYGGQMLFAKVDVMQNQDTPVFTGVAGMPTFQFYLGGRMLHSFQNADEVELRSWTEKLAAQVGALPGAKLGAKPGAKPVAGAPSGRQDGTRGSPKRTDVDSLSQYSASSLQHELDRRAAAQQAKEDRVFAQNPCITQRNAAGGALVEKVVIIGSGPGGATAALYAGRANLCPLVLAPKLGGQLLAKGVDVENFPGLPMENGAKMVESMRRQARSFSAEFQEDSVVRVNAAVRPFEITTASNRVVRAHSVIIATGSEARWLGVEGEWEYRGHGVSGCATCDGALFKGKDCAVVGGGDTAMEEALVLSRTCSTVTLLHRRGQLRASQVLQQRVLRNPKITLRFNTEVARFVGSEVTVGNRQVKRLTHLLLRDTQRPSAPHQELKVSAAFVAIGHTPNTKFMRGQVDMDGDGYLKLTGCTTTSVAGIFAAGDVADRVYQQAITSCASGAQAALDVERYLTEHHPLVEEACPFYGSMSAEELMSEAKNRGLDCSRCYSRTDVVKLLQTSQKSS